LNDFKQGMGEVGKHIDLEVGIKAPALKNKVKEQAEASHFEKDMLQLMRKQTIIMTEIKNIFIIFIGITLIIVCYTFLRA